LRCKMQKLARYLNCFPVRAELHARRALSQGDPIAYAGRESS
jgi:hypothetical protein